MKKSELKTGMRLHFSDESAGIVLLGTSNGDIITNLSSDSSVWMPIDALTDGKNGISKYDHKCLKIEDSKTNARYLKTFYTIWERKETPEYVELISNGGYNHTKIGEICRVYEFDESDDTCPYLLETSNGQNLHFTIDEAKPSTKEAYEAYKSIVKEYTMEEAIEKMGHEFKIKK